MIWALVAIYVAFSSYINIWTGDEFIYVFSFDEPFLERPISNFEDIILSQLAHYNISNGRTVAHVLVQAFCGIWGKGAFAVSNGIVYVLFLAMLSRVCGMRLSQTRSVLSVVVVSLLSFMTFMSPSCQIGYIWMFALVLGFLILFFKRWNGLNSKLLNILCLTGLCVFSLLAGNAHEGLNIGLGGALIIYILRHRATISTRQWLMAVFFGLGAAALCLAPPSVARAMADYDSSAKEGIVMGLAKFLVYSRAFYLLVAVVIAAHWKWKITWREIYGRHAFLWNAWFILIAFNYVIGISCNRQLFGEELIAIILSFRLLPKHRLSLWILSALSLILLAINCQQIRESLAAKHNFEAIESAYRTSADGRIVMDAEDVRLIPYHMNFTRRLSVIYNPDSVHNYLDMYNYLSVRRYWKYKYGIDNEITIIPPALERFTGPDCTDTVIPLYSDRWVVVRPLKSTKELHARRTMRLPLFGSKAETFPMPQGSKVITENDYCRTYYIDPNRFAMYGLCRLDFFFK